MKKVLGTVLILTFVLWSGIRIFASIQFDRNCEGYLKRAADANTVPMAKQELEKALSYIEKEGLTGGYTSVFYKTPDEDMGFWYNNLKASLGELNQVSPGASPLEKSNMLIKLRETILDAAQSVKVTVPCGISVYPNNVAMALFGIFSGILAAVGAFMIWQEIDGF